MNNFEFNDFEFDTVGDGNETTTQAQAVDANGDGMIDGVVENYDMNGDGIVDTTCEHYDFNGDGIQDVSIGYVDSNGDGVIDAAYEYHDVNGDGITDMMAEHYDTDINGTLETSKFIADTDGDGKQELVESIDSNNDGMADIVSVTNDDNGDGVAEQQVVEQDSDNNGIADIRETSLDTNNDGHMDIVSKEFDYDNDGKVNSSNLYQDKNHDGQYEVLTKTYDSDNDGEMDKMEVNIDYQGDGKADMQEAYNYDSDSGMLVPNIATEYSEGPVKTQYYDRFDPEDVENPEAISGDPSESMEVWEYQGDTNRCALYAEKFVIEELTGQEVDIDEFAEIAKQNGWFTEEGGTSHLNMDNMLDYYGIENEMSFHNSVEDIENSLNSGGKVIVSLDTTEVWHGQEDNIFSPESSANHAVEVIGIDRSDPENPMVILNDSGTPFGRGEMVPLDVFEGAWEDGNCQMIECYNA